MNKTQTALTSLVAAIPAAVLAYLLVTAFIGGGLSGMLLVVAGLTLLVALATALAPVGIFVMWPKSPDETAEEAGEDEVAVVSESEVEVAESADEIEAAEDEDEFEVGDEDEFAEPDEDEPPKKKRR